MGELAFLDTCQLPRLFVQGELDEFGDGRAARAALERLPEPKSIVVVPGADHFFTGQLDTLQAAVQAWAAAAPWSR